MQHANELSAMIKAESISAEASQRFAVLMRRRGWSFRKLAAALKTDTSTVSRAFERGLTLKQLERYSSIVGIKVTIDFSDLRIENEPIQVVGTSDKD